MDALDKFKQNQREGWAHFAQFEGAHDAAGRTARSSYARVKAEDGVLDAACGTGVVAVTAARLGARVTGLDLTPELLERARENAALANVRIDFHEGDVEKLPFDDSEFDAVLSGSRPHVCAASRHRHHRNAARAEARRHYRVLDMAVRDDHRPHLRALQQQDTPLPRRRASPRRRSGGIPNIIRERLGSHVKDLRFDRATMTVPALSPQHQRATAERIGPMRKLVEMLSAGDPAKLAAFRREYEGHRRVNTFKTTCIHQHYLMTRATKI